MYKNIIKRTVTIILILILMFLMLELLQRSRRVYITKNIDWLYYGFKMPRNAIPVEKIEVVFFREPYRVRNKNEGKNILFIGGSSTYGSYNDKFYTFPYLLESKLRNISCLNAGRASMTSDDYMRILRRCCEKYCIPDTVVFYTGHNDMFIKSFDLKKHRFRNSRFYNTLERYSFLLISVREKIMIQEQLKKRKDPEYRARFIKEFRDNMRECIKYTKDRGMDVVLMPEVLVAECFSSSITNDYRWYKDLYLELPGTLKELSKECDCYFLDPKDALYADWRENFIDPVHLSDKGNERMSEFLLHNLPL